MSLPATLSALIGEAYASLLHHEDHDLTLGWRHAIWAELGERNQAPGPAGTAGYKRRVRLSILATEHVLPCWGDRFPHDKTPHRAIETAEQVLGGELDLSQAAALRNEYWVYFEVLANFPSEHGLLIFAGDAAVHSITTALIDEEFDAGDVDYNLTDYDRDAWEWDSAAHAAVVCAKGWQREQASDRLKRREFWEWWLHQAVEIAWRAVPEEG